MSWSAKLQEEPWRHDMYAALRRLEQAYPDKPRIGQAVSIADDFLRLGQDPYMEFPASNLEAASRDAAGRYRILVKFLGLLGPQGALPLHVTAEARAWVDVKDEAFVRFLDIFNNRFLQLFYRVWADARPLAQHARPAEDRFAAYLGSTIGIGRPIFDGLDSVPDAQKLGHAGLAAPAAKSAIRLEALLRGVLGVDAQVHEFVGSRLPVERPDQTALGRRNCALGSDFMLGASVFSVTDKIRIRIRAATFKDYEAALPNGALAEQIADLVLFYLGEAMEWDVKLALPEREARPMKLGVSGAVGWTTWLAPRKRPETADRERADARFDIAERVRMRRDKRRAEHDVRNVRKPTPPDLRP